MRKKAGISGWVYNTRILLASSCNNNNNNNNNNKYIDLARAKSEAPIY